MYRGKLQTNFGEIPPGLNLLMYNGNPTLRAGRQRHRASLSSARFLARILRLASFTYVGCPRGVQTNFYSRFDLRHLHQMGRSALRMLHSSDHMEKLVNVTEAQKVVNNAPRSGDQR
jgi:hypothetical protein